MLQNFTIIIYSFKQRSCYTPQKYAIKKKKTRNKKWKERNKTNLKFLTSITTKLS